MAALGGVAVSYERSTPVILSCQVLKLPTWQLKARSSGLVHFRVGDGEEREGEGVAPRVSHLL